MPTTNDASTDDSAARHAPFTLSTERLDLRLFDPSDHEPYARMSADPEVMRYIGTGETHGPGAAWRGMAYMLGQWALLGYGQWAVVRREDGVFIGRAGFLDAPDWPGFELAYLFGREYWGRGYAREAAGAALRIAREQLRKDRVISLIRPQNLASIKVATSLGAKLESTMELAGGPAQVYVY